jgi:hypothetical protein
VISNELKEFVDNIQAQGKMASLRWHYLEGQRTIPSR